MHGSEVREIAVEVELVSHHSESSLLDRERKKSLANLVRIIIV